jgi:CubicO group peptidase (beta-lactamase class C family)
VKNYLPHIFCCLFLILTVVVSCSNEQKSDTNLILEEYLSPTPLLQPNSAWVDSVYQGLSWEERIGELIWAKQSNKAVNMPTIGGLILDENSLKLSFKSSQRDSLLSPLYIASSEGIGFNWLGLTPEWKGLTSSDSALTSQFIDAYFQLWQLAEINGVIADTSVFSHYLSVSDAKLWRRKLHNNNGITIDTTHPRLKFVEVNQSISPVADSIEYLIFATHLHDFITDILNGRATFILDVHISADSLEHYIKTLSGMVKTMPNAESLLEPKVRKMLALKEYCGSQKIVSDIKTRSHQRAVVQTKLVGLSNQLLYAGTILWRNDGTLPIAEFPKKKWRYLVIGNQSLLDFSKGIRHYGDISEDRKTSMPTSLKEFNGAGPLILILHLQEFNEASAAEWVKKVRDAHKDFPIIVAAIGCKGLHLLKELPVLVEVPIDTKDAHYYLAQQLMGGLPINGVSRSSNLPFKSSAKTRFAFTIPEELGIHRDSLKKIDKIAHEAIMSKSTPGCQVFIAKEGKVLVNKSYGYHAYDYKTAVLNDHVYDIASVTKVAATTMMAMHMYEKGRFQLSDSLKNYLPDTLTKFLKHPSRLNSITFQELLTHKSGLPSGLPIYKFIAYVNKLIGRFDRYFCDEANAYFCVEVAKDFYLDSAYLDSLWVDMNRIWPGEKNFKYSDANMNALYQVLRPMVKGKKTYDRYLDSVLYKPLHLKTLGFLPLNYLDTVRHRIAPTEYDTYWRYQVIKGHVHDPNAALYGGVAGNAGLFSNAYDLGVLFQMLLQKGTYGGKHYFKPETVSLFTSHQPGSHRGLGFDKPTTNSGNVVAPDAPYSSFGHTGFTGICAWTDPENELVFVFTSNRIHPSPNNKKLIEHGIRKRIHQVVYQQLQHNGTYRNKATGNVPYTKLAVKEVFTE